jgi:hypothetical protein
MYRHGQGTVCDMREAIRLYQMAATQGEFLAQIELGRMYARGEDVPVNAIEASRWYSLALRQADAVGDCDELSEARQFFTAAEK